MLIFAFDYWVVVIAGAIWLRQANWVGLVVFSAFSLLYSTLFAQEAAHGFANSTLLIDRTGRYLVTILMLVRAWQQRHHRIDSTPEKSRRFGIDVLRTVAIICVVIAHFMPLAFTEWASTRDFFKWFLAMGSLGVNVFFALSGYLIGIILMRHIASIAQFAVVKRFWVRRWLRTLPAAYVSAVISWIVATPNNVRDFFRSIFFVGTIHPLHISTEIPFWWSLGTEELFYVLFPLALFVLIKWFPRVTAIATVLATIVIMSFLGRYLWMISIPKDAWKAIEYVMYIRLDSMVWGILIAWIRVSRPTWFRYIAEMGYAPGLMTVAIGIMIYVDYLRWPVLAVMIPQTCITIGTALLIPACENLKTLGWHLFDRVVVWIAFISYSLYLYHVMVMLRLSREIGPATSWGMLGTNALLYIVGAFGLAALSYYFVEKPVLAWRDRTFSDKVE
jgi:peptidoglycan/LPS O-acetylase OafA/YrhL